MNLLKQNALLKLTLLFSLFILTGITCKGADVIEGSPDPVTLEMWGVFDSRGDWAEVIEDYTLTHPNVTINYRAFTFDEYEGALLNALAEDRGPDIFAVHNTWMRGYQTKMEPLPAELTIPTQVIVGTLRKEVLTELITSRTLTLNQMQSEFLDVVTEDMVLDGQIYALPMAVDTLAMYYNRDLLRNAGIISPPSSWTEFQDQVIQLTRQSDRGTILQSGAAIGSADNVPRSPDILSLLMMQNGVQMTDDRGNVTFNLTPDGFPRGEVPAVDALLFYTDFANPGKQVYTWNDQQSGALESFISGSAAYHFDYSFALETVRAQAPKLNFDVAQAPQILGNAPVNYANFWGQSVSTKSQNKNYAWDFILFATGADEAEKYLNSTNRPTARRGLIESQQDDLDLSPFVNQLISARTWYQGRDYDAAHSIFKDMINEALDGSEEIIAVVNRAARRVNQTL